MTFGITEKGFKMKTFEDIINEIESKYRVKFGNPNFKIDMYTPEGIHSEVIAIQIKEIWEQLLEVVNNTNLDTASGVWLDKIGVILKLKRRNGKYANGLVKVTGLENTVIPKHTLLTIGNLEYFTINEVVLNKREDDTFYGIVEVISDSFGEVYNQSEGVTLKSEIEDVEFVTKTEIKNGEFGENDTDYRARLKEKREYEKTATYDAVKKGLESIETVKDVLILSPDTTPSTEIGTIKIYIDGDNTNNIFEMIAQKKACGIITTIDESATHYTKKIMVGNALTTISYNQISKVIPHVKVEIQKMLGEKTEETFEKVKEKIMNYINGLSIGETLDFMELYSEIRGIYEVRNIKLEVTVKEETWTNESGYDKLFNINKGETFVIAKTDIEVI